MMQSSLHYDVDVHTPPSDEAVRAQLERIVTHALFSETTRMKRFLRYIVEETLAGRSDRLKGYTIGLEVFDRADSFDPQSDTIVRVQAGQMRRRLDLFYSRDGRNDPIRIVVPKGTYVPKFLVQDAVPKLTAVPSQPSALNDTGAGVPHDKRHLGPSIAVLTFTNLSGDSDKFFAEGMTSEIINALVRFRFLRVMARTATVDRSLSEIDVQEVGRKFGADYILTGNIRRAGDLVRVTADLIDVKTRDHVFTQNYDRRLITENLLQIQEDIASYVAANVGSPSGFVNRFGRRYDDDLVDVTAYESILRFYDFMSKPDLRHADKVLADLRDATQKYPNFSSAWAALCMMITTQVTHDMTLSDDETTRLLAEAFEAADIAIQRDAQNALAYHAMFAVCFHQGNLRRYTRAAEKGISLNPNDADLVAFYAVTQTCLGHVEEAQPHYQRALALNSRPPFWYSLASMAIAFQDENYQALIEQQKAFMDTPNFWSHLMTIACYGQLGNPAPVQDLVAKLRESVDDMRSKLDRITALWQIYPDLRSKLYDGWTKAGLLDAD